MENKDLQEIRMQLNTIIQMLSGAYVGTKGRPFKQLLTSAEVAKQLQISEQTIRNWVSRKFIPYQKIGHTVRFDQTRIDNWILQRSVRAKVGGAYVIERNRSL